MSADNVSDDEISLEELFDDARFNEQLILEQYNQDLNFPAEINFASIWLFEGDFFSYTGPHPHPEKRYLAGLIGENQFQSNTDAHSTYFINCYDATILPNGNLQGIITNTCRAFFNLPSDVSISLKVEVGKLHNHSNLTVYVFLQLQYLFKLVIAFFFKTFFFLKNTLCCFFIAKVQMSKF